MYADSAAVGMDEAHAWVEQFLAQTGHYAEDVFS
jgi:hypothetical protein